MKNQLLKYTLTIIYLMSSTVVLLADSGDPNDPDASNDPPAPIDSWVFVLLIAGLTIGVYYLYIQKTALSRIEK